MVFVDSRNLGYMPFVNTWLTSRYESQLTLPACKQKLILLMLQ